MHTDAWQVNYCPDAGPSVKVGANGTIHIAWWTGKPGAAGTQYTQSKDGGRTFGTPVPLGLAAQSRAAHIQLAQGTGSDSGTVIAAWDDGTRQVPQIVARISRDGGASFGPAEAVSDAGRQAGYPMVTLQRDSIRLAWQKRSLANAARDSAANATKDTSAASPCNGRGAAPLPRSNRSPSASRYPSKSRERSMGTRCASVARSR